MSIDHSFRVALSEKFADRVRFDEPMKSYMAYGIGGPADALVFPKSEEELSWIASQAGGRSQPVTVVGAGTNLLVRDEGIRGITIVLRDAFDSLEIVSQSPDEVWVRCGGGVSKQKLLDWACASGLSGLEFSSGVPGTLGGGIFMNAGRKYGSYGGVLLELGIFNFLEGAKQFNRNELSFGYRQQSAIKNAIVVWAVLRLTRRPSEQIKAEVERIVSERAQKQPLDFPSCGSTFKNTPGFSAGRLIEKAGLKGLRIGGAEISTKHANFILKGVAPRPQMFWG